MDIAAFARVLGLEATIREQNGVLRRDQALAAGLNRHRIDNLVKRGTWVPVLPRVYATGDAFSPIPVTAASPLARLRPRGRVRAAWLWAGPHGIIGGEAAAWWWGLTRHPPASVTVIVPPNRAPTARPGIRVVRAVVDRRDLRDEDWIRVTSPSRTCLDLARSAEPDRLADAVRKGVVDADDIARSLDRSRGRRGQRLARDAARDIRSNPWSEAERAAHRALRSAGVTGWVANPRVRVGGGDRFPDLAFETVRLAVEIDGRAAHDGRGAFDRGRHNEFVHAGWTVLHFTASLVIRDPAGFVAEVVRALTRLGGAASAD